MSERRKHLVELRQRSGLTQSAVARKARLSDSKLSLYENGQVELTAEEERRLERFLKSAVEAVSSEAMRVLKKNVGVTKNIQGRRFVRKQLGLTQIKLARAAKIPCNKLIQWELGRVELSPEEYERWERVVTDPSVKENLADLWGTLIYVSGMDRALRRKIEEWAKQKFGPSKERAEWLESFEIPHRKYKLIGESNG